MPEQTVNTQPAAGPQPIHNRAGRSGRAWTVLAITILLALVADLGSKYLSFEYIASRSGDGPTASTSTTRARRSRSSRSTNRWWSCRMCWSSN